VDHEKTPRPAKTPHLHVRTVEGLLGETIAITGSAKALLKLRTQIDRALRDETSYPFEEGVYRAVDGTEFEVAVKRVKCKGEMEEPVPKPEWTAEKLPWSEIAKVKTEEVGRTEGGEE